ncbi:cI-like putative transcriptional regulator [Burkholderia phage Bcep22]|uniref:CI-like putative transcriptional regulator n=1 Tax=Burkholderia phage Bcep22 TaxID=2883944 RepID=Q6V7T1_9CAUD|nr:cI-like putative transcriptional regulator [Burkholderia phage Bcep22]AAQ54947.1 cI-like putative transcriptional regulator [Burkholderia phage Bcep22]
MAKVKKQYFLNLMESRKLSMRGLAQKMDMQHSQLSLTLSGQRKMQLEEAAQLSQIFGVPLAEIAVAAGVDIRPTSGKRVNVIGFVGKDGSVTLHGKDVVERADAPPNLPDGCVAIQFRTADSPLAWQDGWVAFLHPNGDVTPESFGRFSLCKIKDGPTVVATPKRGYRDGTFNLSGPYSRENVPLESATPLLVCRF